MHSKISGVVRRYTLPNVQLSDHAKAKQMQIAQTITPYCHKGAAEAAALENSLTLDK